MDKELTPKQQTSEAIRQAETILIMTGLHPSIDQVASTVALAAILRKFGKKVTSVISDEVPASAKFLPLNLVEPTMGGLRDFIMQVDLSHAEVDKLKYTTDNGKLSVHITPFAGSFQSKDVSFSYGEFHFDLVIILGVASYARIDKIYGQNAELLRSIPLINIDFHRNNEQYGAINLIETTAASLAEMLIALAESLQSGLIDATVATTMFAGIMAATDRFTASHTTSKTMTIAAQMLAMGADQQKVVRGLYRNEKDRERKKSDQKREPQRTEVQRSQPQPAVVQPVPQQPALQPIERIQLVQSPAPRAKAQQDNSSSSVVSSASASPAPTAPVPPDTFSGPQPMLEPQAQPELERTEPERTVGKQEDSAEPVLPPVTAAMPLQKVEEADSSRPAQESSDANQSTSEQNDDLLPPAAAEPEPLINDTTPRRPRSSVQSKSPNPTNNPTFAQRLDEFEY